jgi:amino acid transporter
MSEEVRNAPLSVPKVMLAGFGISFCMSMLIVVTLCYHITSIEPALTEPTTYPAIWVLRQAMSNTWLTVYLSVLCVFILFSNFSYLAAVSRDLFAFARDEGLPWSKWIGKVDQSRKIPTNAYLLSGAFSILVSLIYIGSPVAFYAIGSLLVVSIMQCYFFSISCVLWRRLKYPETLPHAQFSLGKLGVPLNVVSLFVVAWTFFWAFWPQTYPITASGFNWAIAIYVATLIIATGYYFSKGNKYNGPVVLVEGRKPHNL